jgi:hypothetical protein
MRVLFDESHSQAWTIRPEVAAEMQPSHPADASYALAAAALRARDLEVVANPGKPLDAATLAGADVLVLAHPSDRRYERTVSDRSPRLTDEELDAVEAFVRDGGGLLLLGETEQDKYGNNLGELAARFGLAIEHDTVQDYGHHLGTTPSWVLADVADGTRGASGDVLARVRELCFYRAGTVAGGTPLARTSPTASTPRAPLAAVAEAGAGRVAVLADSDLFGDDCLADLDHELLLADLVHWLGVRAFARPAERPASLLAEHPAWARLRDTVDALRVRQEPDGSCGEDVRAEVEAMVEAIGELAPLVPHQADYVRLVQEDLRGWVRSGFAKPDFTRSLEAFRPDRQREDGIEHLVVFPMYTQNGSPAVRFEALLVRVPWPAWLAELEATRYGNPKFVPVTLTDFTAGYDSECAVLFPETVSVAGRPANHFGGIFCDREAERFRRVVAAAADVVSLNLPADAAALLRCEALSQEAYALWDLVHDRAHSRGDLPFDPFMIRQRMPYWMYSLEELRCDLTAFGEAVQLEREGVALARHVQYAILFDRLFRFPVTGARVRNYDGLGGQLLFAYLHKGGWVRWTDNRLTIDWHGVAGGVAGLRAEVEELYRAGIDRSKLAQWCAAHDLVSRFVPPATGSRWVAGVRQFTDVEDPRPYIDEVLPDEFPLSMFYVSLKARLEPVISRPRRDAVAA